MILTQWHHLCGIECVRSAIGKKRKRKRKSKKLKSKSKSKRKSKSKK